MNWKKVLNIVFGILLLVSLIFNGYSFYQLRHLDAPECVYVSDTVTIHTDSIITKTKWKTKFDTITEIQYKDTVLYDTIYLPIEHNQSEFSIKKDSLTINETIWHSGFHSSIDSIKLDYNWNYELPKPKSKKIGIVWFVGPTVTGGVNFNANNKTFDYGPSVGISVGVGIGGIIK